MAKSKTFRPGNGFFPSVSEGFIYYESLGTTDNDLDGYNTTYWKSVRAGAESYFSKVDLVDQQFSGAPQYLRKMAEAELQKEKIFLETAFGASSMPWTKDNYKDIIDAFNTVLNVKPVFQRIIDNLDSQVVETRSVTAASFFGGYLKTELNQQFKNFRASKKIEQYFLDGATEKIEAELERYVKVAIDKAIERTFLASATKDDKTQVWKEAYEELKRLEKVKEDMSNAIFTRFNLDDMLKSLKEVISEKFSYKEIMENVKLKVRSSNKEMTNKKINNQAGGIAAEHIKGALTSTGMRNAGIIVDQRNVGGKMSTADTIYSADFEISIVNDIEKILTGSQSKRDTRNRLRQFYNNSLSKFDKGTIIYENTKNYQLGKYFKGFHGGQNKLTGMGDILTKIGYPRADSFINLIKNTMGDALFGSAEFDYREKASKALAGAVGYLLFDDIDTLGQISKGPNVIHMFSLTDVVIPLSFLLHTLAEAMDSVTQDPSRVVKVSFSLPKKRMYEYPIENEEESSQERWEKQRAAVDDSALVTLTFLNNFKGILRDFFKL